MKNYFTLFVLLAGVIIGCQKKEEEVVTQEPSIIEDSLVINSTQVIFNWTIDYPGKICSVVEISLNEDMSNATRYGSEEETSYKVFSVTVTNLEAATKYYYRYLIWNPITHYQMEVKSFFMKPEGVIGGVFSVSSTKQVYFSKGNLQYQASTNTWQFAENQFDCIGKDNDSISSTYDGWIDLFGWGTSGYESGANCYQPWSVSTSNEDYMVGGSWLNNLVGADANSDWGVYNAIRNGGNHAGYWRTLTSSEWSYIFNTRNCSTVGGKTNARYAKAKVVMVRGVILFPDNYTHPSGVENPLGINSLDNSGWNNNSYSASEWNKMENQGAVFLPAAGSRFGKYVENFGGECNYWSTSRYDHYSTDTDVCYLYINYNTLKSEKTGGRYRGNSVRLVCSAR